VKRVTALLISIIGGAILGYALFLLVAGAVLGFLWLYVFGDDPWPKWSETVLGAAIIVGGCACWAYCALKIWRNLQSRR
jgi:hypothetical protein